MKVLWICNVPTTEALLLMNKTAINMGGWMSALAEAIGGYDALQLFIAFPYNGDEVKRFSGKYVEYFAFPKKSVGTRKRMERDITEIINQVAPDLIHIHGTELDHNFIAANRRGNIKGIVSIQGLVSVYAKHCTAGIPFGELWKRSLGDLLRLSGMKKLQRYYIKQGEREKEIIRTVGHVIGRTSWDKACTQQINPDVRYYHCNEMLRDPFYKNQWAIEDCERYSIFFSQAMSPVKGLHYMLEAMPLILIRYPKARLYVAGRNITKSDDLLSRITITQYGRYIKKLIRRFSLEDKVVFTGYLDEDKMCERLKKSHVFVSASTIENSPNSLGEAMILGVPCVSSCVGGVQDMLVDKKEGFIYPYDEPYMLAHYVSEIFSDNELARSLSANARAHALKTHDRKAIAERTIGIYKQILEG